MILLVDVQTGVERPVSKVEHLGVEAAFVEPEPGFDLEALPELDVEAEPLASIEHVALVGQRAARCHSGRSAQFVVEGPVEHVVDLANGLLIPFYPDI